MSEANSGPTHPYRTEDSGIVSEIIKRANGKHSASALVHTVPCGKSSRFSREGINVRLNGLKRALKTVSNKIR